MQLAANALLVNCYLQVDAGVDLAEALAAHYVGLDAPLVAPDNVLAGQFARTSRGGQKQIEFFGETKIRKRQQVRVSSC
jgi:tubulin-specific chaperone E